jgi:hypothetical protein
MSFGHLKLKCLGAHFFDTWTNLDQKKKKNDFYKTFK